MQKYLVEFLGTLFLMFVILYTGNWLAISCALAVIILLGGAISGGSFNPAVTLGLLAAGKINTGDVIPYIIAEVAGALAAFELFKLVKK
jgi:aquaporin Z